MKAKFDVNGKDFTVDFSSLGFEKYYYADKLLLKRWSFKFNDRLSFDLDDELVEIDVSISRKSWSTRAFVNGELVAEELFPEFKQKVEVKNKGMSKRGIGKNALLWFVLTIVFMSIFNLLK